MVPPRLIRRLVLAPLLVAIAAGVVVASPLLGLVALASGLARRSQLRGLRLLLFALVWLTAETAVLFMLLGLWITSGFGGRLRTEPYQSRHYAVMRWFLDSLYRGAERTFGLRVEVEGPDPAISDPAIPGPATSGPAISGPVIPGPVIPESDISESDISGVAARLGRPVIVLSRHAGPGDSLLLVRHLLSVYGRRPRLVLKAELQYDPSVDVVGNRTPNVFVRPRETGEKIFTDEIRRLAGGLDRDGALVIFPEGGNWTPGRWRRGIRRLEQRGRGDLASRARRMPNLLPPRTGGALTAIAACPEADVIFVAHAGLDNLVSLGDVWRDLPVGQVVRARWWRVPFDEVPRQADHEAQVKWLYDWWQRIDSWISEHRPAPSREQAPAELTRPRTSWCEAGDRDARLAGGTEEVPTS